MFYRINVAQNNKHLFATAEHSITSRRNMIRVYGEIRTRFPSEEGFQISVTFWQKTGQDVDVAKEIEKEQAEKDRIANFKISRY